jgi:hypothetical protein
VIFWGPDSSGEDASIAGVTNTTTMGGIAVATGTTMMNGIQRAAACTFTNTGMKKENTAALLNNQPACSAAVNCLTIRILLLLLLITIKLNL